MLTYLPGTYSKSNNQIDRSGALQQIRNFLPFWPFLHICRVCILTPNTPLSQFLPNSLRYLASPQRLKVIKSFYISQRVWPGRSQEFRCFATKLHTVINDVYIVWYDQNCSRLMRVPPWTRLHCDIDTQHTAPLTGDCKCHVCTVLLIIRKHINRDWSPLALTNMHETLNVHRSCRDVQRSLWT